MLFGTTAAFAEIVTYYRTQLKEGGDLVFREPPTHTWDVGRFREETMVFPPGVTVKDFTWGGSKGYPNPRLNGQPAQVPDHHHARTSAPALSLRGSAKKRANSQFTIHRSQTAQAGGVIIPRHIGN